VAEDIMEWLFQINLNNIFQ